MLQTYALQNAFQLVNTSEALVPLVGIEIQTRQQLVNLRVQLVSAWAMFTDLQGVAYFMSEFDAGRKREQTR